MTDNKGFTLLETVITLLIAGIIASIGMVKFSMISQTADINEDMHKISSFLKSRRLSAFTIKDEIGISIDLSGKIITAKIDPGGTAVVNGSISLNYPVATGGFPFTINSRGLFTANDTIHLATVNTSPEYSCVSISAERIRLGGWDGTSCTTY